MNKFQTGQKVKYAGGDQIYTVVNIEGNVVKIRHYNGHCYIANASSLILAPKGAAPRRVDMTPEERFKHDVLKRLGITRIIYNKPATIVFFNDGDKKVVKTRPGDYYSYTEGVLLCVIQHLIQAPHGLKVDTSKTYNIVKKQMYDTIKATLNEEISNTEKVD